ncbi:hypothetical protein GN956_G3566 [Arapaima gigas]
METPDLSLKNREAFNWCSSDKRWKCWSQEPAEICSLNLGRKGTKLRRKNAGGWKHPGVKTIPRFPAPVLSWQGLCHTAKTSNLALHPPPSALTPCTAVFFHTMRTNNAEFQLGRTFHST